MNRIIHFLILACMIWQAGMAQVPDFKSSAKGMDMPYRVVGDRLAIWDGRDYVPVFVKGINLGVSVPGTQPGELAATREEYRRWFGLIKEAGYNAIRLYTLHYPRFYEELKTYNELYPQDPLLVLHGIWLEEQETAGDLYNLTTIFDQEIREVVSAAHGDITIDQRFGKAYGTYTADISPWILGFIIGREIFPGEVQITNENNPLDTEFQGLYYSFPGPVDPAEVWIAQRLDNLVSFEKENYGVVRPAGISSWPTLDPLYHPTEHLLPGSSEDIEQIDLADIQWTEQAGGFFIGYHAYPYYPDFITHDPDYAVESDPYGPNNYLGYLRDLKSHYSNIPLFVAEFGVPSSWGSGHLSPTGMHHGGITEEEQGAYAIRMLDNIRDAGCAGGIQFALIDEWFKQTWITNPFSDKRYRHFWHNITAPEQNFGILSFASPPGSYELIGSYPGRDITGVRTYADFDFFRIRLYLRTENFSSDTLWVALDTYLQELGESVLPNGTGIGKDGDTLRAEFALEIPVNGPEASLYVIPSYDIYGIKQLVRLDTVVSTRQDAGEWNIVRWKTNYFYDITQYIGKLSISDSKDPFQFLNAVTIFNDSIEIRLPYTLINFHAPNKRRVMHYQTYDDNGTVTFISQDSLSDGIALTVSLGGDLYQTSRYTWVPWEYDRIADNPPLERKKKSYFHMKSFLPLFNNPPIGLADEYSLMKETILEEGPDSGLLVNDYDIDGNRMTAALAFGNGASHGQLYLHPDGSFQYIPDDNFAGSDYFMYYIDDGYDYSSLVPVNITVKSPLALADALTDALGGNTFRVYPNPGEDRFFIESETFMDDVTLYIHDVSGRLILEKQLSGFQDEIYLENVITGIYLFKFTGGNHTEIHKVIIREGSR